MLFLKMSINPWDDFKNINWEISNEAIGPSVRYNWYQEQDMHIVAVSVNSKKKELLVLSRLLVFSQKITENEQTKIETIPLDEFEINKVFVNGITGTKLDMVIFKALMDITFQLEWHFHTQSAASGIIDGVILKKAGNLDTYGLLILAVTAQALKFYGPIVKRIFVYLKHTARDKNHLISVIQTDNPFIYKTLRNFIDMYFNV